ncbi:MAG: C39 family peptidase [Bacteroidetes bacterium]|nr:C39 family peptidase [Bacteroidota bacterium]
MSPRHNFFLNFDIEAQPDDITCGPTCLHALYQYYNDGISLKEVINKVKSLKTGGTLAVMLGNHALKHGYHAHIYTYNLNIFDPSWFSLPSKKMAQNLKKQMHYKFRSKRLQIASKAYIKFIEAGGKLLLSELDEELIKKYLRKSVPILTGLSATYLYGNMREIPYNNKFDSIRGEPVGHFVIINGFDEATNMVYLADPMNPNPLKSQYYSVTFDRLINSIMLGIVTYDANLLIIEPKK